MSSLQDTTGKLQTEMTGVESFIDNKMITDPLEEQSKKTLVPLCGLTYVRADDIN